MASREAGWAWPHKVPQSWPASQGLWRTGPFLIGDCGCDDTHHDGHPGHRDKTESFTARGAVVTVAEEMLTKCFLDEKELAFQLGE